MTRAEECSEMDRRTADRLLRGDRSGHPLDQVLAAATAPATAHELSGEAGAMAAFRGAAHAPAARRHPSMLRSAIARLLTLKVAVVALGTSATIGGVALAASTGALPGPLADDALTVSSPASRATPETTPEQAPATVPQPAGTPTVQPDRVTELCRQFNLQDRDTRTRALNDGRFGELVRRAGGQDRERVEQFCGSRPRNSLDSRTFGGTYSPRPGYSGQPERSAWPEHSGRPVPANSAGDDRNNEQRPDDGRWSPAPQPSTSASPGRPSGSRR